MKLDINFAFEGFRLIVKRFWALPVWGLVYILGSIASVIVMIPFVFPLVARLSGGGVSDPAFIASNIGLMIVAYIPFLLGLLFTSSVIACAIYRAVLRDEPMGFGFVRIGGDEWRIFLVNLVFTLLAIVVSFGIGLVMALIGGLLSVAMAAVSSDLSGIGMVITMIAIYGVMFWLMVRMSLFGPQTFDQKKFNLFGTWGLTGGKAWLLFFGYLVAAVVCLIIYLAAVFGPLMAMTAGNFQDVSAGATPNLEALGGMTVGILLYLLFLSFLIVPMMMAIMIAPSAAAYKALTGGGSQIKQIEKVF